MLSAISHVSSTPAANETLTAARKSAPQSNTQSTKTDTSTLSPAAQLKQKPAVVMVTGLGGLTLKVLLKCAVVLLG